MRVSTNFIYLTPLLLGLLLTFGCSKSKTINPLIDILESSEEAAIQNVMSHLSPYEVQIHYTQIDRIDNDIIFTDYIFQEDDSIYFYPASSVKFPIAVIALERLSQEAELSLNTKFYVEGDTLETTFADEVIKVFAISDNAANNRLFEFLGQDKINHGIRGKGAGKIRISHRLSTDNADDVTSKPLIVYLNDSTTTLLAPNINSPPEVLDLYGIKKGTGFMEDDILINESFDFSLKNYYPLKTQQEVLKRVIFPGNFKAEEQFELDEEERKLLLRAMSSTPATWGYDTEEYYDSYVKFFIYGDSRVPIPEHVKIYNKVGYAYGTLTDCAYILDTKKDIEFLLSATILVNKDGIFNDDHYEYEETGIPFLAAVGREIYNYELNRN